MEKFRREANALRGSRRLHTSHHLSTKSGPRTSQSLLDSVLRVRKDGGGELQRQGRLRCDNMKLLTHNLLSSHVRGVGTRGFLLRLQATKVRINPVEFNPEFVARARIIPKVEWAALVQAWDTPNLAEVPKELTEGYEHDETFFEDYAPRVARG